MTSKRIVTAAAIIALALTGCTKGSDSAVIAKVNNTKITTADFKRQLDELQPQMLQAVATDAKARKKFLEDLIGIELVLQEARRQGLDKDAEFQKKQKLGIHSMLAVPIYLHRFSKDVDTEGVLQIYYRKEEKVFTPL